MANSVEEGLSPFTSRVYTTIISPQTPDEEGVGGIKKGYKYMVAPNLPIQ
jgi:hypothetical protein